MMLKLNDEQDILDFITIARRYPSPVDVICYDRIVDAKSIVSVMTLPLYNPIEVKIFTQDSAEQLSFEKDMERFVVA